MRANGARTRDRALRVAVAAARIGRGLRAKTSAIGPLPARRPPAPAATSSVTGSELEAATGRAETPRKRGIAPLPRTAVAPPAALERVTRSGRGTDTASSRR